MRPSAFSKVDARNAYSNPTTIPDNASGWLAMVVEGGSVAAATVSNTASPIGGPGRCEVFMSPDARPSSPGFVPVRPAMFKAVKLRLAPKTQSIMPGRIPRYPPPTEIGMSRADPSVTRLMDPTRAGFIPNRLTSQFDPHPPPTKNMPARGRKARERDRVS